MREAAWVTLDEADRMIEACRANGVLLLYGESLFFTPKYVKAKEMADSGAFGKVHLIKQGEKHFGPHAEWFWDIKRAGGGALFDLGCHGIGFAYWFLGRPKVLSVYPHLGTYVHGDKTQLDDEAVTVVEFEGNAFSIIENSWTRRGGMDDRIEVYGEGGLTIANLQMGNALPTYSEYGFGYAVEKAPTTTGWSYPVFEELWNYGFPQRCATSRAPSADWKPRGLREKMARSYWRLSTRATLRPAWGRRCICLSSRRQSVPSKNG